jgi:general secretion pathway protein D
LLVSACILSACNLAAFEQHEPPDNFDKIRALDLTPRTPQPVGQEPSPTGMQQPVVYQAASEPVLAHIDARDRAAPGKSDDGYELNFENTPVTTVAKTILGDILGLGYTIDPRVQGTVSLSSARPVAKSDILFVLENALRISNVVLIRDVAGYRLVPLGDAVGSGNIDRRPDNAEPGYGISVVPLQYVSAPTLIKLLDSFATKPGMVRADADRNLLLIQGSGAERRTAIETILSFDTEWMRGESVGIFPVHNSTPEPLITELENIVDSGDGGLSQNLIKFQPIDRMNSILVVTKRPQLLRTAATWIARLDRGDTSGRNVHVYRVKYGDARQMARVLNDIFLGSSGAGGLESPTNEIAPGSGTVTSSSSGQGGGAGGGFGSSFGSGLSGGSFSNSNERVRQQLGITPPNQNQNQNAATAANASAPGPSGASNENAPMLTGIRITPDVVNNSLLVFSSEENYRVVEHAIRQIDRPQMQVAIDATIAEVTLNNALNYGVQFYLTSGNLGSVLNTAATAPPTVDASGAVSAFLSRTFPAFNLLVGPQSQPRAILDALDQVTTVKVLSNPSLVVLDNQPATLQVGDEIPVSTGSANVLTTSNTIVNTIDYRDTGIILHVTPRVGINGTVRLDIEQEISNVNPNAASSTSSALTPTVSQRRVKSSVSVPTGQTVLLAGLISETQNRAANGLPFLDRLPSPFGDAFATLHNNSTNRTELIIFIRPQVIRDAVDAHFVAEELRAKLQGTAGALAPLGPLTTSIH